MMSRHHGEASLMAHEAEIIIPGSFVVLQGNAGDGLSNTMDTLPDPDDEHDDEEEFHHVENVVMQEEVEETKHEQPPPRSTLPLSQQLASRQMTATVALNRFSGITPASLTAPPRDDPYIVVTDDPQSSSTSSSTLPPPPLPQQSTFRRSSSRIPQNPAIERWQAECRNNEIRHRKEWRQAQQLPLEEDMWWQSEGRICLFRDVPTKLKSGVILRSVVGTLSPGSTVVATDIFYLHSLTLSRIAMAPTSSTSGTSPHNIYPLGRQGWIQLVKLDHNGRPAYAVLSMDGYPFLAPGLPSLYVDPHVWVWRVTCAAGAFVREGLDLNTAHLDTLPYGSLIRATRKTVNSMGLSRIRVQSILEDSSPPGGGKQPPKPTRVVDGWCSEFLNPLSGQRGMVAQPVPFPVPALYRVTLPLGAVIRSDVELSSRQIGHAPVGAILVIVGRSFSEHPMDKCIERLQLAGNGGWISVRLNRPPPADDLVVELVGIDGTFEPESPGMFHLEAQRKVQVSEMEPAPAEERSRSASAGDISSIDDSQDGSSNSTPPAPPTPTVRRRAAVSSYGPEHVKDKCLICLTEERNATIVHGETGHVACCLICARILKARGDKCPVCRLNIDSVIQQFWA